MSSIMILKELLDDYYSTSNPKVAWVSAFTPSELLTSMDIRCFYPENLAATLSGNRKNTEFIDCAKAEGYSENICSYTLLFEGGSDKASKYRVVPDPELLVMSNNQCGTLLYWWEHFQTKFNLPLQFINYPKCEGDFLAHEKKYITDQFSLLADTIKMRFGNKFDQERLASTIENSIQATALWKEIQLLRKKHYIPPKFIANALLPIVIMKGHRKTVEYYRELLAEFKTDFADKTVKKKLLWLGYPFWFLKEKYPFIHDEAGIVMDIYTSWWILDYSGEALMDKIANAYGKIFFNMPLDWKVRYISDLISEYEIDGVITHLNKSCKRDSIGQLLTSQYLKENLNIPTLVLESDMANPDWYNSENIRLHIDAFLELL